MATTPGKVGELLKSYLLKQSARHSSRRLRAHYYGRALHRWAGNAGAGFRRAWCSSITAGRYWSASPSSLSFSCFIFQNRAVFNRLLSLGERMPVVSRGVHHFHAFYNSSYELFRLPNLLFGVVLGVVSWSGEVVAFVLVMIGLGSALFRHAGDTLRLHTIGFHADRLDVRCCREAWARPTPALPACCSSWCKPPT